MIMLITIVFIIGFILLCTLNKSKGFSKERIVYVAHASKKYHLKDCHFILDEAITNSRQVNLYKELTGEFSKQLKKDVKAVFKLKKGEREYEEHL